MTIYLVIYILNEQLKACLFVCVNSWSKTMQFSQFKFYFRHHIDMYLVLLVCNAMDAGRDVITIN